MGGSSAEIWIIFGLIAAAATLGVLYALAARVRDEVAIHDLRIRSMRLRDEYLRRLESMRAGLGDPGADCGVDILPDEPEAVVEPAKRKAA
ncbi:MAG: hypothetical protein VYC34_08475 [Planctomycetota bacterium]|nr:hypothetical protein [Planctomycetota bacterium]